MKSISELSFDIQAGYIYPEQICLLGIYMDEVRIQLLAGSVLTQKVHLFEVVL